MTIFNVSRQWAQIALFLIVAIVVATKWGLSIKSSRLDGDTVHTIQMSHNLAAHGVISGADQDENESSTPTPTNYREPLPALLLAVLIRGFTALEGPKASSYFEVGVGARLLRLSNLVWGAVLCVAVAVGVAALTGSVLLSASAALWAGLIFEVNSSLTESPAAALLALVSLFLMLAVKSGRPRDFVLAGLLLGALILTKGAFQYVAILLLAGIAVWLAAMVRSGASARTATLNWLMFASAILLVVGPWMVRNSIYLGSPQITQRGGIVLLTRALKNEMNATEYLGSFYVWAPPHLSKSIGLLLGFGPDDLKRGGRLQRLNRNPSDFIADDKAAERAGRPEDVISFYRKARAERIKLRREFEAEGVAHYGIQADNALQEQAKSMILANPLKHLAATLPFLWRGAAHEAPLLALFAGLALWWRRTDLFVYVAPGILMIAFYTFLSHNIPRYNDPVFAVLFGAIIATCYHLFVSRTGRTIP